jgi:hypothetical protein
LGDGHDVERRAPDVVDSLYGADDPCRAAFFGWSVHLVEQMAAFSIAYVPGLLHLLARRLS